ncbi:unnamed protein product [Staurois parvus]|uniref:Uncharacterized protein n=1 Tax=Staurois parvus TaxID=386267 RepID=A0ABN9HRD8_9NEOB|nr:unnamed protein product [Staurois parvus]
MSGRGKQGGKARLRPRPDRPGLVCSSPSVVFTVCSGRATMPSGSGPELPSI